MAEVERVDAVKEAIINHLRTVGPKDWEEVQKDFPDIPNSSFWRYVNAGKEYLKHEAALASNPDLFTEKTVPRSNDQDPWEQQHLNAIFRGLKQGQRFSELYTDALALRDHALHGESRIKNPGLFAKSIRIREQLLYAEMNVVDSIHTNDAGTKYWDKITDAVMKASPETGKAILLSLHELNKSLESGEAKDTKH